MCKIEWRRNEWNVTLSSCDPRATFIGDYNQFECGIKLSDVTVQEAGLWSCHMEAYQVWPLTLLLFFSLKFVPLESL